MRRTCSDCGRKHLAEATILLQEARTGYPSHVWLAMGHVAEAEYELIEKYPDVAVYLRGLRKRVEKGCDVNLLDVIELLTRRLKEKGVEEPHVSNCNGRSGIEPEEPVDDAVARAYAEDRGVEAEPKKRSGKGK